MNITTHLLLALLSVPALGGGDIENLCDIINPDTGIPTRCELSPEGAPIYDEPVCCNAASCYKSDGGGCPDSLEPYHCDLGEVLATDEVVCYVEVPYYCDLFPCGGPSYQAQPESFLMCCNAGVCWHLYWDGDCELNDVYACDDGVSNLDGTVTCLD